MIRYHHTHTPLEVHANSLSKKKQKSYCHVYTPRELRRKNKMDHNTMNYGHERCKGSHHQVHLPIHHVLIVGTLVSAGDAEIGNQNKAENTLSQHTGTSEILFLKNVRKWVCLVFIWGGTWITSPREQNMEIAGIILRCVLHCQGTKEAVMCLKYPCMLKAV